MAATKLDGLPINTNGELPAVGSQAPDFHLVDSKLNDVGLDSYTGKKKILYIVSSLDTFVCGNTSKIFNERIAGNSDTVVLVISADLPFAQTRFCRGAKLSHIIPLSMMRSRKFAKDYGVLLVDGPFAGITARAVVVLDENNRVLYTELVDDIGHEPDYDAAFNAAG